MISRRAFLSTSTFLAALGTLPPRQASGQQVPGVSADKILFGQAAPFEGPAQALGLGMRLGIQAAFAEVNARGGVNGRRLELTGRNDSYEPSQSIVATEALIRDGVFALIGPVGTPTAAAAHPIAARQGVPFIGPFTGAEVFRNPYQGHIVNIRASYFQETEVMIERLTLDVGCDRIAILYQDDAFGRAGLAGTKRALQRRSMELVTEGTFERNTTAVRSALLTIRRANPQAVVMIGPYKPCAEFIKLARRIRFQAVFMNISFVGSETLAQELGEQGAGVYVTQVVPFPGNTALPIVASYQRALHDVDAHAQPGFISLEGYIVGRTVIAAAERAGRNITRESLMAELTDGRYDLGGIELAFAPNRNQGSDRVFITVINREGRFEPVERLSA